MTSTYYISRVPVLSCAHLRLETLWRLMDGAPETPVAVVAKYREGCFLHLKSAAGEPDQSSDRRALYRWARRRRYHWIRLDADGSQVDGLPIHDW